MSLYLSIAQPCRQRMREQVNRYPVTGLDPRAVKALAWLDEARDRARRWGFFTRAPLFGYDGTPCGSNASEGRR
jgi:hypothetical protein